MLWFDRAGLDAAVYDSLRSQLGGPRPRVLAWAPLVGGGTAVGLPDRLCVRSGDDWLQVEWATIRSGGWEHETNALGWETEDGCDSVVLAEQTRLPELFRERVQASIVLSRPIEIPGTPGATVTARRDPSDPRAQLAWSVVANRRTDLSDPVAAQAAAAALAQIKAEWDIS